MNGSQNVRIRNHANIPSVFSFHVWNHWRKWCFISPLKSGRSTLEILYVQSLCVWLPYYTHPHRFLYKSRYFVKSQHLTLIQIYPCCGGLIFLIFSGVPGSQSCSLIELCSYFRFRTMKIVTKRIIKSRGFNAAGKSRTWHDTPQFVLQEMILICYPRLLIPLPW